jgi:hypothetical protein
MVLDLTKLPSISFSFIFIFCSSFFFCWTRAGLVFSSTLFDFSLLASYRHLCYFLFLLLQITEMEREMVALLHGSKQRRGGWWRSTPAVLWSGLSKDDAVELDGGRETTALNG